MFMHLQNIHRILVRNTSLQMFLLTGMTLFDQFKVPSVYLEILCVVFDTDCIAEGIKQLRTNDYCCH